MHPKRPFTIPAFAALVAMMAALFLLLAPTEAAPALDPGATNQTTSFAAFLDGDQVVPPVHAPSSGVGRFSLLPGNQLRYELAVSYIADITAAHIRLGAPGDNGAIVFTLFSAPGTFDPQNPIEGELSLTNAQANKLKNGQYYVNIETDSYPDGQIRGQILPGHPTAYTAMLSGANENQIPVDSRATGQAFLVLNGDLTQVTYRVMVADIAGVTAAHVHYASEAKNGPIIFILYDGPEPFDEKNPVNGVFSPTITDVAALVAGDHYVNVHTAEYPEGEIRGQLRMEDPSGSYLAVLTGSEEQPSVVTDAAGVGTFELSADLSQIDYHLAVTAIDNVTAAHLHTAWPNQNGPIAHPLFSGGPPPLEPGSPVEGVIAAEPQDVLDLWSGYYYANVHSSDHPAGEIRGQVGGAKLFRADLSGANEVPPVDTLAVGRAIMALSEDASTLYYRLSVNFITDITAAHIHLGAPGVSGGIIFPLYSGGGPFDPDHPISGMLALTEENVLDLAGGNYYVNVHTAFHDTGEIRGQLGPISPPEFFFADLDGDQEVPPVDTPATGTGRFRLDDVRNTFHWHVDVNDITGVTAAHIHTGPVGVNGPPLVFLYDGTGPAFDNGHPVGDGAKLGAQSLVDLLTGYLYANVHTTAHGGGEIRGQIEQTPVLSFVPVAVSNQ
jgi:hypothetical protein